MHLSGMHLQEEARSECLALVEEGPGEACLMEVPDPYLGTLLVGHAACCLAARWESMVFLWAVGWHRPDFAGRLLHYGHSGLVDW